MRVSTAWRMRPQRLMWIGSRARAERVKLGKGWQVRLRLKPWRSKVPVRWSAPIVGRRTATDAELFAARAVTPGWPDKDDPGFDAGFVLEFADGTEWVVPQGALLTLQRLRTPQRDQEAREWSFQ